MGDAITLTVHEQRVAAAYASSGEWPEDAHDRRILDYLITSGQVSETGLSSETEPAEPGNPAEVDQAPGDEVAVQVDPLEALAASHGITFSDDATLAEKFAALAAATAEPAPATPATEPGVS